MLIEDTLDIRLEEIKKSILIASEEFVYTIKKIPCESKEDKKESAFSKGLIGTVVNYKFGGTVTIRCIVESAVADKLVLTPLAGSGYIYASMDEIEEVDV